MNTLDFPDEIVSSNFHPSYSDRCFAGSISGYLYWIKVSEDGLSISNDHSMKIHRGSVQGISLVSDGESIVTVSEDRSIKFRSTESGNLMHRYESAHGTSITCLRLIDSYLLATGDNDGYVKLWDYRKKKELETFSNCGDYISDLTSKDKRTLLATSGEGTLNAYDLRNKKLITRSDYMNSDLIACKVVKNGTKVLCSNIEGVLYFFDWNKFEKISDSFPRHPCDIECMTMLDGRRIATGGEDGKIRIVNLYPHRVVCSIGQSSCMPILTLCSSNDKKYIVGTSTKQESLQLIWQADCIDTQNIF